VERRVVCSSCDAFCQLTATVRDGRVVKVAPRDHPLLKDVICMKGAFAPKAFAHPERLMHPLRRVGPRGGGQWERVSWQAALDDIAERLRAVVAQHGPEAFAVASSNWNTTVDNGMCRRFMNLLGSPNWISGVAYCMGNTSAVNRMVYGWYPQPDLFNTNCIVLFGHNPRRHSWTPVYKMIRLAQARGAKLIVLDPRKSENAERADLWLPLRAGTDAAMCLGWLNVILAEGLYDAAFVERWTHGFEEFAERVREFPVERVASITGVEADLIVRAARTYAEGRSVIPWSPITDQQVSSTSAIRLHCALRAVTGNLDVVGGERFNAFDPRIVSDTDLELHDALSETQKAKQLGAREFPVFTHRGMAPLADATERVWGRRWANLVTGNYMAHPLATFRAMADGDPYPVKAFFSLGNNTLLAFANMQQIHRALMNQDLVVAHEHMLTPTAQLADYVLPGDSWLERPSMMVGGSQQAMEPPGECKSVFFLWRELAHRMGLGQHFPWPSLEALYDHRLERSGVDWNAYCDTGLPFAPNPERKYEQTGFATPTGKVELYSTVLEQLGFDPLPYHREAPEPNAAYPLSAFVGVRDDEYFQTGHRHVPDLRRRVPDPTAFLHAADAGALGVAPGDWLRVETEHGAMIARAELRAEMPRGLVRVPHGWWKPEATGSVLSGAWHFSDAQLSGDAPETLDREQGVPHLKGIRCRVERLSPRELEALEREFGAALALPAGPAARIAKLDTPPGDIMHDEIAGAGAEFSALDLAHYGRGSVQ
jgi:anaerobic selenocysteine-containing dehydrogenase